MNGTHEIPATQAFSGYFKRIKMHANEFTSDQFKPGSSGEAALVRALTV